NVFCRLLGQKIILQLDRIGPSIFDRGDTFVDGVDGNAVVTNLACFLGPIENLPGFAVFNDINGGIMKLVEIDIISLKAFETFLEHAGDVGGGKVFFAAIRSNHDISALGGEDDLVSPAL